MDGIMGILPIILIASMVVFLVFKLRGTKSNYQINNEEDDTDVNFFIVSVFDREEDGTLRVDGIVENGPISVGDVFRVVDKNDNIIDNKVVVERIDKGIIRHKYIDEAPTESSVILCLRTQCETIQSEMLLKK